MVTGEWRGERTQAGWQAGTTRQRAGREAALAPPAPPTLTADPGDDGGADGATLFPEPGRTRPHHALPDRLRRARARQRRDPRLGCLWLG